MQNQPCVIITHHHNRHKIILENARWISPYGFLWNVETQHFSRQFFKERLPDFNEAFVTQYPVNSYVAKPINMPYARFLNAQYFQIF